MTTLLCILDGYGLNPDTEGNAVKQAKTPNFTKLWDTNPHATLVTHGESVGLPAGQMGNSEVGHMNIGAGRVVEQWLARITRELKNDLLPKNDQYRAFVESAKNSPEIHLIGLASDGGVHSHINHLLLLIKRITKDFKGKIVLHLITDGRDTAPESSQRFVETIRNDIKDNAQVVIGSICGRFYAMDRDKRWERIKEAYDLYTNGVGTKATDPLEAVKSSHTQKVTDEFIKPISLAPYTIDPEDAVIFWNFREDRMREIVAALCTKEFQHFERKKGLPNPKAVIGFTEYDHTYHLPFLFSPQELNNHLGEVVSKAGKKQLRVAETEKYPHVTYFLNAGIEPPYPGEDRKMLPSPRDVKTYDEKPEMSAFGITETVVEAIQSKQYDLIVMNFANCDMVGHTGDIPAAIKAVETVDTCLGEIISALQSVNGNAVIIADHGNAEMMINYNDGTPYTAHTTFPVPIIVVGNPKPCTLADDGALCDVAPTILTLMGIAKPKEMTGRSLIK